MPKAKPTPVEALTIVQAQNRIEMLEHKLKAKEEEMDAMQESLEGRIQSLSQRAELLQKDLETTKNQTQSLNRYYQAAMINIADSLVTLSKTITVMLGRTE